MITNQLDYSYSIAKIFDEQVSWNVVGPAKRIDILCIIVENFPTTRTIITLS